MYWHVKRKLFTHLKLSRLTILTDHSVFYPFLETNYSLRIIDHTVFFDKLLFIFSFIKVFTMNLTVKILFELFYLTYDRR